jgi:energy-coupling factor transport system permease protein
MSGLLEYKYADSALHRLHPLVKLFMAFLLCAVCFVSRNPLFVLAVIVCDLALAASGGVLDRAVKTIAALAKLSVVIFIVQVLFVREGKTLISLPYDITITDTGLWFSFLFVARLIAISLPPVILLSVTKVNDISNVLVRNLRLPVQYAFAVTTAIRFVPLFSQEMSSIMEAQISRGVEFDTKSFVKKLKLLLPLCVPLLVSSVRRIEDSALSADLRGFRRRSREGIFRTYNFGAGDAFALSLALILAAASFLC